MLCNLSLFTFFGRSNSVCIKKTKNAWLPPDHLFWVSVTSKLPKYKYESLWRVTQKIYFKIKKNIVWHSYKKVWQYNWSNKIIIVKMDSQFITNIIFCAIISVSVYLTIIIVLLHYTYTKIYEKNYYIEAENEK